MGADGVEPGDDELMVPLGRAGEPAALEPDGRPGERIQQHSPIAVERRRELRPVEAQPDGGEQIGHLMFVDGRSATGWVKGVHRGSANAVAEGLC